MNTKKHCKLLKRSLRESILQLWRNGFLTLTMLALGIVILFLLDMVFTARFFADYSLERLTERADFVVPLREDADAFEFDALQNELKSTYHLTLSVEDPTITNEIELPKRLKIIFHDLTEVSSVFEVFKKTRYDPVIASWDTQGEREFVTIIERLTHWQSSIEKASFWLSMLFIAGGIILVMNTFQIAFFARRDEIHIARTVGADRAFILMPLICEGALAGILSSIGSIILFVLILKQITFLPRGEVFVYFYDSIFGYQILASALCGGIGAWGAAQKFLRQKR